jgi:hypothetical protein
MEEQLAKMHQQIVRLKWYTGLLTVLLVATGLLAFTTAGTARFKEISVERINVLESNGQLRLVISNRSRSPENLAYGKPFTPPIPGGNRPGLIFYNDEGTENGGLVFRGGRDEQGNINATGHFSFDQYNQNQVLYLSYNDDNGHQNTGLHIDDWQQAPAFWDFRAAYKKAQNLPEGAAKEAVLKQLMEPRAGQKAFAPRVFVGKDESKTALVSLSDRLGKPRLQLLVDSNGVAKVNFLDQLGNVTRSLAQ